jgi:hypothetical protein
MSDRELLEAAAKAAGIEVVEEDASLGGAFWIWTESRSQDLWSPLTDDGDALRLAVKLGIVIEQGDGWSDAGGWCTVYHSDHKDDPYAATRRAIVRAAAEIGREK